jgi:hypothetical protein
MRDRSRRSGNAPERQHGQINRQSNYKKLPRQKSFAEQILNRPIHSIDSPGPSDRERIAWGDDAAEVYFAFSRKMDQWEERDRQRYELGMRTCENAARLATIVAVGRGSKTVDREDIEWALALAERSFEAAVGGIDKYMREYFEFPKFCTQVLEAIRVAGGWMSKRDLSRKFGRNMRWGNELDRAVAQLIAEERVAPASRSPRSGGHTAEGYGLSE